LLWHYTDIVGLHGIITTWALRFGHVQFLNDATEVQFAVKSLLRLIEPYILRGLLPFGFEKIAKTITSGTRNTFIFSLTETSDVLSHWQRYGADGRGYAIGFAGNELRAAVAPHIRLNGIHYTDSDHLARINSVFEHNEGDKTLSPTRRLEMLKDLVYEFKNPVFADEREWRLSCSGALPSTVRGQFIFVPRGDIVKPYLDITPGSAEPMSHFPIKVVLCGPRLETLACAATERFMTAHGYDLVDIRRSALQSVWQ
jgi:hypothetical protein